MVKEKDAKKIFTKKKKKTDRQTPGSAEKQRRVRGRVREKVRIKDQISEHFIER